MMTLPLALAFLLSFFVTWAIFALVATFLDDLKVMYRNTYGPRPTRPPQPPPNPRPMVSLIDFRAPELRPIPVASKVIPPTVLSPVMHTTNPFEVETALADHTKELLIWSREITRHLEPKGTE